MKDNDGSMTLHHVYTKAASNPVNEGKDNDTTLGLRLVCKKGITKHACWAVAKEDKWLNLPIK